MTSTARTNWDFYGRSARRQLEFFIDDNQIAPSPTFNAAHVGTTAAPKARFLAKPAIAESGTHTFGGAEPAAIEPEHPKNANAIVALDTLLRRRNFLPLSPAP